MPSKRIRARAESTVHSAEYSLIPEATPLPLLKGTDGIEPSR
jgi:hypothetical protein